VLAIAERQHNLVTYGQLIGLGLHRRSIQHRLRIGRLHRIRHRVYAVGSRRIGLLGEWMAAVLACGPDAVLSHQSAAALWGIKPALRGVIHISVPPGRRPRTPGIIVHRRARLEALDIAEHAGIPVTSIVLTLIDMATTNGRPELEAAISEADKRDLIDPEELRAGLPRYTGRQGVARLAETLDHRTFTLTDSQLERRFIPIATRAGLPRPLTQEWVNGYRVDFYWPDLKLVVETDGLRYHRTPTQQARDRRRDQAHAASGLTQLRFTHAQVRFEPNYVEETLRAVAGRL
jgi:very-short-patch-repair endonuclease